MKGDNRARHCALCEKHVYNISAMTAKEVTDLVERIENEFCGRLDRRRDGTVLTANCPVSANTFSSGRLHRVLTYAVIGVAFITTGAFIKAANQRALSPPPSGSGVTFDDWKDWALTTLGVGGRIARPAPSYTAGRISCSTRFSNRTLDTLEY